MSARDIEAAEEQAGDELATDLTRLVVSSPPDSRFRLLRRSEESARWEVHGTFPRDNLSEERVAELFGGGKYWAQLLERTPAGGDTIARSCKFRIPGAYIPPIGRLPSVSAVAPGAPQPSDAQPARGGATATTREQLDMAMAAKVIELMNGNQSRGMDWGPIIAAALPVVASGISGMMAMMLTMATRKSETDPVLIALLEKMEANSRREASAPGPIAGTMTDLTKSLKQLEEVRGLLKGGSDDDDGGEKGMWSKLPALLEGLMKGAQSSPASDPAPDPADATRAPWERLLRHYGPELIDAAHRGINADLAAGMIASYMPADATGVLVEFIQREDAVAAIAQALPEMQHFTTWTTQLVAALRAELIGDDPEGDE